MLPQALLTLNLLRGSRINPQLSAQAQLHGPFDFNRTPLGPPGTRLVVLERPAVRETWAPHAVDAWYLGPAMKHYRCFTTWIINTRAERIADTVVWFPSKVVMPTASSSEAACAAARDLIQALQHPAAASALSPFSDSEHAALHQLADIFRNRYPDPTDIPATNPTETPYTTPTAAISTQIVPVATQLAAAPHQAPVETQLTAQQRVPLVPFILPATTRTTIDDLVGGDRTAPGTTPASNITTTTTTTDVVGDHTEALSGGQQSTLRLPWQQQRVPTPAGSPLGGCPTPTPPMSHGTCPLAAPPPCPLPNRIPRSNIDLNMPATYATRTTNPGQRRRQGRKKIKQQLHHQQLQPPPVPPTSPPPSPTTTPTTSPPTLPTSQPQRLPHVSAADIFIPHRHCTRSRQRYATQGAIADGTVPTDYHANAAVSVPYKKLATGQDAAHWLLACSKERGRLAQGLHGLVKGTDTMFFIAHSAKPANRKATYLRVVCEHKPAKPDPYRIRFTAGGDKVDYLGKVSTPTVDITTVKCHLNSVISTSNARYMTVDLQDFYLNTPMPQYEYMCIPVAIIPADIMLQYQLAPLIQDGFVMVELRKGIYGLPQAGILANDLLCLRLAVGGYHPAPHTPGLFLHNSLPISFTLWVDDFGIKYTNEQHVWDLLNLLGQFYKLKIDWTGSSYLGITLKWDYLLCTVELSMPGYVERALQRFQHPAPTRLQHSPYAWTPPQYGVRTQLTESPDHSPRLLPTDITRLQQIIGVFLYYARVVDNTMLVALGTLAAAQSEGTEATMRAATQFMDYCATHPNATIRYTASDMILHIISDASYLSVTGSRSRLGGWFFLSTNIGSTAPLPDTPPPPFNAPVLVNTSIIGNIVASAGEAELGGLFHNCKDGCMLRNTLNDLGHPQPQTPVQTDNACAVGIANETVKQKRSKAIDMRYYWVRDRVRAKQFMVYWRRGAENDADYFTKHHAPAHHRLKRSRYLYVPAT